MIQKVRISDYRFMFFCVSRIVELFLSRSVGEVSFRLIESSDARIDTFVLEGKGTTVKYFMRQIRSLLESNGLSAELL